MLLALAAQAPEIKASIAVLIFGLVIGVFGHVIKSRALILTGILIIGLFSVYFAFGVGRLS